MKKERSKDSRGARESTQRRATIQVIARAASVLRALENEADGLSLARISQRVGLARSTVQRIVDSLSDEHFIIAASPTSGVRLGPGLIRLAASASIEFDQITRPVMAGLSKMLGETVDLSVLKGAAAVFTDQVQGIHRLRAVSAIGETFPLHCTANGKALLSVIAPDRLDRLLQLPMRKFTATTITKAAELSKEIEACRRSGVAYDLEEHTDGICAVGTAFLDPVGRAVALSVPVPTPRFKKLKSALADHLLDARREILSALSVDSSVEGTARKSEDPS